MDNKTDKKDGLTRRDFIKGASCAALGLAMGVSSNAQNTVNVKKPAGTKVILVRDKDVIGDDGKCKANLYNA